MFFFAIKFALTRLCPLPLYLGARLGAWGRIHNNSFSSYLINGPNTRPLYYIRPEMYASYKHSYLLGTFVSYEKMKCCEYGP